MKLWTGARLGVLTMATALVVTGTTGEVDAASAPASVTIGEVPATADFGCAGPQTVVQRSTRADGSSYTVPFDGVITSFSTRQGASMTNVQIRLGVFGPPSGGVFEVRGRSGLHPLLAGGVSTFDARIPVQAGSLLGAQFTGGACKQNTSGADDIWYLDGDLGTAATMTGTSLGSPARANVAAVVEADVDHDGYGDATQDACPASALSVVACPAPETTITQGPKARSRKREVALAFTSTTPRSTFLVVVDGKPPKETLSPFRATLKPGRHTISVQAVSPLGVVDSTPATVAFKIKKQKRR